MASIKDMTNRTFGKLTVKRFAGTNKRGEATWECKCDCGKKTIVPGNKLRSGHTTSCGCVRFSRIGEHNRTHGMTNSRLYNIWSRMKARCNNPKEQYYYLYGGRGIKICDEWANSFELFYEWSIKNGYKENLTIDRKNTNGDYCPSNCKWSDVYEQANNKRNNHFITAFGQRKTISQWARVTRLNPGTISRRIHTLGWNEVDAVTIPVNRRR